MSNIGIRLVLIFKSVAIKISSTLLVSHQPIHTEIESHVRTVRSGLQVSKLHCIKGRMKDFPFTQPYFYVHNYSTYFLSCQQVATNKDLIMVLKNYSTKKSVSYYWQNGYQALICKRKFNRIQETQGMKLRLF